MMVSFQGSGFIPLGRVLRVPRDRYRCYSPSTRAAPAARARTALVRSSLRGRGRRSVVAFPLRPSAAPRLMLGGLGRGSAFGRGWRGWEVSHLRRRWGRFGGWGRGEGERGGGGAGAPSRGGGGGVGSEPARVLRRGEEPVSPRARCGRDD